MKKRPRIVVLGRPNVGKSTLFNRLAGRRRALVYDLPGVTRDWTSAPTTIVDRDVELVDTGGLDPSDREHFASESRRMALGQIERADVLLVAVDGISGPVGGDLEVATLARRTGRPVVLAVTKCDVKAAAASADAFWELGLGPPMPVSAEHGVGIGDLLDRLVAELPEAAPATDAETPPRVAVVGRPNVGKSSLVNRLMGEERMIVSEVPGTTRDTVDSLIRAHGKPYLLVDTAGIRKAPRTATSPDILASVLAEKSLERADVAVLVIDAHQGPTTKDAGIGAKIVAAHRPALIFANKWDLGPVGGIDADAFLATVRRELSMLAWAPILLVSAKTGRRTGELWRAVDAVLAASAHRIPTGELNRWVTSMASRGQRLVVGGEDAKLRYVTQVGVRPPTFAFFFNRRGPMAPPTARYLENRLRELHPFEGAPLLLKSIGPSPRTTTRARSGGRFEAERPGQRPKSGDRPRPSRAGKKRK